MGGLFDHRAPSAAPILPANHSLFHQLTAAASLPPGEPPPTLQRGGLFRSVKPTPASGGSFWPIYHWEPSVTETPFQQPSVGSSDPGVRLLRSSFGGQYHCPGSDVFPATCQAVSTGGQAFIPTRPTETTGLFPYSNVKEDNCRLVDKKLSFEPLVYLLTCVVSSDPHERYSPLMARFQPHANMTSPRTT